MITPRFKLTQTESTVTIQIRAPYCNLGELEVTVDDDIFIFYTSPYYLRLHLPGRLVEDNFSESSFDSDSGQFSFTIKKAIDGEHFPDLDLITKLLTPKVEVTEDNRKITIVANEGIKSPDELNEEFGFALCGKENFNHVSAEFKDVFEVDPREVNLGQRHKMRVQFEQGKFNIDHYLSDYIENEEILELIALEAPWDKLKSDDVQFSDQELDFLKDLPNKTYNLSETQVNYCHCCLVDILYAYCYDRRTTQFEGTSESGWTIVKLAATFCWLDVFQTPKDALVSAFRRSVIYPLYRNFELNRTVLTDLRKLLDLGEKYIIKCLIEMYHIFLTGDCCRYILNNLFIKDYIIYIMKWDRTKWREVVEEIKQVTIEKSDLGLNLQEIEDDVCRNLDLNNLQIRDDDSDDFSDTSSDDSSTESD
ncbi:protein SHQ1 homolog [Tribolium castaneum]|uniref:Protein SHQ1 homolog n=1 Tax=Tribolium castaneum TaxID=7070 RepID=D6W9B7_TRICA|nr:PREDICTED: protein SHQ1 homolog [Tribolium castaneum]EEZ98184.1 Protein SHQ1 homolog-like Protein [Tribolium castaneum]|eukprot:XP_008195444.1 PREDICTED: protein SHQ1 homolog [Tribolium castaneum]